MKKRLFSALIVIAMILSSCGGNGSSNSDDNTEKSAEMSSLSVEESAEESIDESIDESTEESIDESTEESIDESVEESSEESSEEPSEESSEESADVSTEESKDESSNNSGNNPQYDYEEMDTPVIPVPDDVKASESDSYFNNSVFVGNSIMLGYQKFANNQRAGSIPDFLGNSKFFVAGSFGVYHNNRTPASKANSSNPSYQGVKYSVEDAVGVMGVDTVYINFMGLNDLALYYDSKNCARKCADDVISLIKKINTLYPDVKVVILSATYLTASTNNKPSLNNRNLSLLNNYLLTYCNENGLDFIDIASQLTEKGCLADKYASDGYCHIWTSGYKVWTAILRDYATRKMDGTYTNPERMPVLGIN